jgi:hypothetical protein
MIQGPADLLERNGDRSSRMGISIEPGVASVHQDGVAIVREAAVRWRIQMSQPASSEEQRIRLDLLVDEASMLSFPASDPAAVVKEESASTRDNDMPQQTHVGRGFA